VFLPAGAFPEIQIAQYPLDMGRPDQVKSERTLAVTVSADGNVNYDAIVKQGQNKNKFIAATHDAMVPKVDRLTDGVCFKLFKNRYQLASFP
jgi:SNW domain-containing protein 1